MGTGFLISAPLLAGVAGNHAVFFMAILLVVAYLIGEAMRFNIRHFEPIENEHGAAQEVALLSRVVLSGANFISVTYSLQLLAAFVLHIVGVDSLEAARWVTTGFLVFMGGVGVLRGLDELERLDKYAMSLNLGMIRALLTGLLDYNIELVAAGHWRLPDIDANIDLHDARRPDHFDRHLSIVSRAVDGQHSRHKRPLRFAALATEQSVPRNSALLLRLMG